MRFEIKMSRIKNGDLMNSNVEGKDRIAAQIVNVPAERISCSHISRLDLSHSQLTDLPALDNLFGLSRLNLSHNLLTIVPKSLISAKCLRVLDLSHNKIKTFPQILLDGLFILETLNLSDNLIESIPRPACNQHLVELSASNCSINAFPPWILFERHCLKILNLSHNRLFGNFELDKRFVFHTSCAFLKKINLANTALSTRSLIILKKFSNLEYLDVSSPHLKFINFIQANQLTPEFLPSTLRVLHCSNNGMAATPSLMQFQLQDIYLENNRLFWIGTEFVSAFLKVANLSNCVVYSLPDNFGDCVNLEYLNLSFNDLSELPASFAFLTNLKHLDLYRNSLNSLPTEILPLKQITAFDICFNHFEPPTHPWGSDSFCYDELRKNLRSKLEMERNSGRAPVQDEPCYDDSSSYEGGSIPRQSYTSSESDDEKPIVNDFPPRRNSTVVIDEDWDLDEQKISKEEDEDNGIYRDNVDCLAIQIYEDVDRYYAQFLNSVPARIKQSPFFYHTINLTERLEKAPVDVPMDDIVPGQFDDV